MGITNKAYVSCKREAGSHIVEAAGSTEDILTLTILLLTDIASGIAKSGAGLDEPERLIVAMCETARENLHIGRGLK